MRDFCSDCFLRIDAGVNTVASCCKLRSCGAAVITADPVEAGASDGVSVCEVFAACGRTEEGFAGNVADGKSLRARSLF